MDFEMNEQKWQLKGDRLQIIVASKHNKRHNRS